MMMTARSAASRLFRTSNRLHRTLFIALLASMCCVGCEAEEGGDELNTAYDNYLNKCGNCHGPSAAGFDPDNTEKTLDFTTVDKARETLTNGKAAGLKGNQAGCNDVPFVVAGKPEQSLIIAVLDQDARKLFDVPAHPNCDNDAISDMALKVDGEPEAADLDALKKWITDLAQ